MIAGTTALIRPLLPGADPKDDCKQSGGLWHADLRVCEFKAGELSE
jgi:hypothetical protein